MIFSYLHDRTTVRSGTGALQVPWTALRSGTGALQVPRTALRSGSCGLQVLRTADMSGAGTLQVPWTAVRSGAEIGLLSLRLSVSQGASLGDFLLAPACPIEKVTLWVGFFF